MTRAHYMPPPSFYRRGKIDQPNTPSREERIGEPLPAPSDGPVASGTGFGDEPRERQVEPPGSPSPQVPEQGNGRHVNQESGASFSQPEEPAEQPSGAASATGPSPSHQAEPGERTTQTRTGAQGASDATPSDGPMLLGQALAGSIVQVIETGTAENAILGFCEILHKISAVLGVAEAAGKDLAEIVGLVRQELQKPPGGTGEEQARIAFMSPSSMQLFLALMKAPEFKTLVARAIAGALKASSQTSAAGRAEG